MAKDDRVLGCILSGGRAAFLTLPEPLTAADREALRQWMETIIDPEADIAAAVQLGKEIESLASAGSDVDDVDGEA